MVVGENPDVGDNTIIYIYIICICVCMFYIYIYDNDFISNNDIYI